MTAVLDDVPYRRSMAPKAATRRRGDITNVIIEYLASVGEASLSDISAEVQRRVGTVQPSSIRSQLNANTPGRYERVSRGHYRLAKPS
jgi:hypothetical protein